MVQATNADVDSGAAELLTTDDKPTNGKVTVVKAFAANSGTIYVSFDGTPASSSNGVQLGAGQQVNCQVANLNMISVRASADNQGVTAHSPG
jgi:S-adenosylmethionine synthetase